jgi:hypothetical protein
LFYVGSIGQKFNPCLPFSVVDVCLQKTIMTFQVGFYLEFAFFAEDLWGLDRKDLNGLGLPHDAEGAHD